MNTSELVEWQILDSENGLVMPWWTHPFLEVLKSWDLSNSIMLETGSGRSASWLRKKCKWVDSVESSDEWALQIDQDCKANGLTNGRLFFKFVPDGVPERMHEYFELIPKDYQYDIISIDGLYRTEMIEWAINHFKGRTGIIIVDNLDQDFVWISPKAMELLEPYEGHIFIQPDHINHEGKPWNTRYYIIK
jgi:hypothetical protein